MVEEGLAGIVKDNLIHQLYNKDVFKQLILERDQFLCNYCGAAGNTIDHIIPLSQGGLSTFSNCVCACEQCNKEKGDLSVEEYLRRQ
jgi:5-methylcytosine-specific restriction endonuclease McrA